MEYYLGITMRQADHRGVVQIQKFSAFLKVHTKVKNPVHLIPVASYADRYKAF